MKTQTPDKILIVDDEETLLNKFVKRVCAKGYQAQGASDGVEAIAKFKQNTWDLVITDLKMPNMNGFQLLETITQIDKTIPIIVITGQGELEDVIELLKLGVYDYLTKPYQWKEIEYAINRALDKRHLTLENLKLMEKLKDTNQR